MLRKLNAILPTNKQDKQSRHNPNDREVQNKRYQAEKWAFCCRREMEISEHLTVEGHSTDQINCILLG